jgi:hypothetical protein
MERVWTCDIITKVSGNLSRLEASRENHSMNSPLPRNLLEQICNCAKIEATFSTNPDGTTRITLVNNGSAAAWQRVKLSVIQDIIERAVFRKSREQIEDAAKKVQLEKVISWKIYDFPGAGSAEQFCLFMYSRKDLSYLPLTSLDRIDTDDYHKMMQKFWNMLK